MNISKIACFVLLTLLFPCTLFAHKNVEAFEISGWRKVSDYILDEELYSGNSVNIQGPEVHKILDRIELTLSHFPITDATGA